MRVDRCSVTLRGYWLSDRNCRMLGRKGKSLQSRGCPGSFLVTVLEGCLVLSLGEEILAHMFSSSLPFKILCCYHWGSWWFCPFVFSHEVSTELFVPAQTSTQWCEAKHLTTGCLQITSGPQTPNCSGCSLGQLLWTSLLPWSAIDLLESLATVKE